MSGKEKKAAAASQETGSGSSTAAGSCGAALPGMVSVSSVDLGGKSSGSSRRGFRINVSMERSQPGLLVSVLEAFENLGLDVLDADVSCADDTPFHLQATVGGSSSGGHQRGATFVDEQMVRQAVLQAITKCMDHNNDGEDE